MAFAALFALSAQAMPTPIKPLAKTRPLVVIDPGHGGSDAGTVVQMGWSKISEKDVALWIARDVARALEQSGIRAVLTRWDDQELALKDRTAIANRLRASVFLSIHLNASHSTNGRANGRGFETFILNNSSEASSHRLAQLENSVLSDSIADVDHAQNNVGLILKDHLLDGNLSASKHLACGVQSSLVKTLGGVNRGVKQALFYVLLGADMPSVLVEAGFLSDAQDRARLLDARYRKKMSRAIAQAISTHLQSEQGEQRPSNCKVF